MKVSDPPLLCTGCPKTGTHALVALAIMRGYTLRTDSGIPLAWARGWTVDDIDPLGWRLMNDLHYLGGRYVVHGHLYLPVWHGPLLFVVRHPKDWWLSMIRARTIQNIGGPQMVDIYHRFIDQWYENPNAEVHRFEELPLEALRSVRTATRPTPEAPVSDHAREWTNVHERQFEEAGGGSLMTRLGY